MATTGPVPTFAPAGPKPYALRSSVASKYDDVAGSNDGAATRFVVAMAWQRTVPTGTAEHTGARLVPDAEFPGAVGAAWAAPTGINAAASAVAPSARRALLVSILPICVSLCGR